jgi:hypothetical protein
MKKQQLRRKAPNKQKKLILPEGRLIIELVVWSFSTNEETNCHIANELAKAIQLSYQLDNFGPLVFGIDDPENQ